MTTGLLASLAFACAAAGCVRVPAGAAPRGEPAASVRACADADGPALLELVNETRRREGLEPLIADRRLGQAAQGHAEDMARSGSMSHEGRDGSRPPDRVAAAGYDWRLVAENVAAGQPTAAAAFRGWMESAAHRANILDSGARHLGVGHAYRPDAPLGHYWVSVFAAGDGPAQPPAGC